MPTVFTGRKRDSVSDGIGLWMSRDAWLPTNLRHGWTMLNLSVAWASHQTGLVKCVGNQQWKIKQEASYEKHTHRHEKQSEYRRINSDFSSTLKQNDTLCRWWNGNHCRTTHTVSSVLRSIVICCDKVTNVINSTEFNFPPPVVDGSFPEEGARLFAIAQRKRKLRWQMCSIRYLWKGLEAAGKEHLASEKWNYDRREGCHMIERCAANSLIPKLQQRLTPSASVLPQRMLNWVSCMKSHRLEGYHIAWRQEVPVPVATVHLPHMRLTQHCTWPDSVVQEPEAPLQVATGHCAHTLQWLHFGKRHLLQPCDGQRFAEYQWLSSTWRIFHMHWFLCCKKMHQPWTFPFGWRPEWPV